MGCLYQEIELVNNSVKNTILLVFKFYKHFQHPSFLFKICLLGVFLFTSTLSFAFDCSDQILLPDNHSSENHTASHIVKIEVSHDSSDHDEWCHTSEKIQKDSSIQLKKQSKLSTVSHASLVNIYVTEKTNNTFWTVKKVTFPRDPPRQSQVNLVWIVILNC